MMRRAVFCLIVAAAAAAPGWWAHRSEAFRAGGGFELFTPSVRGCAIVVPARASAEERRAAEMLRVTFARASGRNVRFFPILEESVAVPSRAIFVGDTRAREGFMVGSPRPPFDSGVGLKVDVGFALLCAERRENIECSVGWFLEKYLGATWFMPGPLGEHVPPAARLVLPAGQEIERPGFVSRSLALGATDADRRWSALNRLDSRFEQKHAMAEIFSSEDFRRQPEMAPRRDGARHLPPAGDQDWQPDLTSSLAVDHTVAAVKRAFAADPRRVAFPIGINDSIRYDDSAATLKTVGPPRFFRHRPDYSDLVFGFANAVADKLPERWLSSYAYYWAENAPRFPVARNVVPFLAADRTQWVHDAFAAEDRALIERWCRSGAELVGVYDYLHGAPFLTPRPMLQTVAKTIPFFHEAGVRAFHAEAEPNWALDGPKLWLAAQLLWSPQAEPAKLLARYYRDFWGEAGEPMREFHVIAEQAWRDLPGPALWLRFFQDEDEATIHSTFVQQELRACLTRAASLARSDIVRRRVEFAAEGFAVCEAFWAFGAARTRVSRLARDGGATPDSLLEAWETYRQARAAFMARVNRDVSLLLRHEPDSRVARALIGSSVGLPNALGLGEVEIEAALRRGPECLEDATWRDVSVQPVGGSTDFEWTGPGGVWRGQGEPWEGRQIELNGSAGDLRALRFAGCRTESIGQWRPAIEGTIYAAQVRVRAKTSPGTATFLILSFLDAQHRHLDVGHIDRLPEDSAVQEADLCVLAKAPSGARFVGFAVRVLNQVDGDFAEFSGASLRRWPE